jgi:hypothetical protein
VLETFDLLDVIAIQYKSLQIWVSVCILDLVDQVASIVNELKVSRWLKIECLPDLVPRGLQLDQMLELGEIFQMNELVVGDVDILEVLVLIDALNQLACL